MKDILSGRFRYWYKGALISHVLAACVIPGSVAPQAAEVEDFTQCVFEDEAWSPLVSSEASIISIGFTVFDMDRSIEFFTRVLDFEKVSDVEASGDAFERLHGVFAARARVCVLHLGNDHLELTQYLAPEGRPIPVDSRSNDLWFQHIAIITSDMDRAYARLREYNVRYISPGPQRLPDWNPNAGGIEAFYFRDPDGHVLEILAFPSDKGDTRWHRATDQLFLGIDHTAIVVSDTDRSVAFYRDVLRFEAAGESENYGHEQERLNSVFGARLRITSLRAPSESWNGPAIELLEYLAPGGGREAPSDARSNDLWHWQITIQMDDVRSAMDRAAHGGGSWVSPGVIERVRDFGDFGQAGLICDPDGHALRIVQ